MRTVIKYFHLVEFATGITEYHLVNLYDSPNFLYPVYAGNLFPILNHMGTSMSLQIYLKK